MFDLPRYLKSDDLEIDTEVFKRPIIRYQAYWDVDNIENVLYIESICDVLYYHYFEETFNGIPILDVKDDEFTEIIKFDLERNYIWCTGQYLRYLSSALNKYPRIIYLDSDDKFELMKFLSYHPTIKCVTLNLCLNLKLTNIRHVIINNQDANNFFDWLN